MGFTPSLRKKRVTERCSSLVHVAARAHTTVRYITLETTIHSFHVFVSHEDSRM